ncbi:MAG TPA: hypothetical protein PLD59_01825 [Tepidisphaeraceae bacterium]|nr:hypothetical protein [Tepidisphaeraceae bacterium]
MASRSSGCSFWPYPIASVARTLAQEELFREPRDWCKRQSEACHFLLQRKFFYIFTCEYCLSHWVTLGMLLLTNFRLLFDDWRGWVMAFFALPFVANAYLNLYARLRVDITQAKTETKKLEKEAKVVSGASE